MLLSVYKVNFFLCGLCENHLRLNNFLNAEVSQKKRKADSIAGFMDGKRLSSFFKLDIL
jgi:hypothetical protein